MRSDEERRSLYACKQSNGKYRKEIENTGVFLSGIDEMMNYIAQQPNGQWEAFDFKPMLTDYGWERQGDRPDKLTVEGDIGLDWKLTLCHHERYSAKIKRIRRTMYIRF